MKKTSTTIAEIFFLINVQRNKKQLKIKTQED